MKNIFIKYLLFISIINFILNNTNYSNSTISDNNLVTDLDNAEPENNTDNKQNIENNNITIKEKVIDLNINNITFAVEEPKKNLNLTIYDKNKILELITKEPFNKTNNSKTNENITDDDNLNKLEEVENIIIQNTHEDQLAESLFYFLSFVLIIFIILFLYKFYKCYCENTIKEFGEEGISKAPNNDPELQRISTHDEDNIIDVQEN